MLTIIIILLLLLLYYYYYYYYYGQRSQCVHSLSSQSIVAASQATGIGSMGPGEHGSSSLHSITRYNHV